MGPRVNVPQRARADFIAMVDGSAGLNALYDAKLEQFEALRAKFVFYAALKEKVSLTRADEQDLSIGETSLADASKIESERNLHYEQVELSLRNDIALEIKRGDELRKAIEQSMLESKPAKTAIDLESLERECANVETLLDTYADASLRIELLTSTKRNLEDQKKSLQSQLKRATEACDRSEQQKLSLNPQSASPNSSHTQTLLNLLS